MNQIIELPVVNFEAGGQVFPLTIHDADGHRWVTSQEVGAALGSANPRKLISRLIDSGELKETKHYCSLKLQMPDAAQPRKYLALSYRGIIRVSMRSDGKRASGFRDWAEDVLYEVMMTGRYISASGGERLYETTADFHKTQHFYLARENQIRIDSGRMVIAAKDALIAAQTQIISLQSEISERDSKIISLEKEQKVARVELSYARQRKARKHLTLADKKKMVDLKREGRRNCEIAHVLHRSSSTVAKVLRKHGFPPEDSPFGRKNKCQEATNG